MDHGPAVELGEDRASGRKAALGIYMFIIYLLVYGGFVAVTAATPKAMGIQTILGLNLACLWGFALIVLAIVMGLIYNALCNGLERRMNDEGGAGRGEASQ